jgi:hypothetical protein
VAVLQRSVSLPVSGGSCMASRVCLRTSCRLLVYLGAVVVVVVLGDMPYRVD